MKIAYADPTYDAAEPPYENTCRPDKCEPATCAFRNPCAFDGGMHTEPRFVVSAVVVSYR